MKFPTPHKLRHIGLATLIALGSSAVHADEREQLETLRQTTINLIELLVQSGVLPAEKAAQIVQQAQAKAKATTKAQAELADAKKPEPGVVRVQYVPEFVRKQIADEVREEVVAQAKAERWGDANAIPEWVDRFKFEGDMRLGYQSDMFSESNASITNFEFGGQDIDNTTEDRQRTRLRARLGITAKITPDISAAFRLSTGNTTEPVSTNQTLGQTGNKYSFVLDRAYVKAHSPTFMPWLTASAGRIPNPFFSTDLLWDDDLNFEGLALQFEDSVASAKVWRPFGTLGIFPLEDIQQSSRNRAKSKWLTGAQVGVEWVPSNTTRAKVGLGIYDYRNISGILDEYPSTLYADTAPAFRQKGNTLFDIDSSDLNDKTNLFALAADYRVVNLTGMIDINLYNPVHVILTADYVDNVGFSASKTFARTDGSIDIVKPETKGYLARVAVGMPTMLLRDDWQLSLTYRYLEADAVLDAFTDSDFHLGGTNSKGFIVGGQYSLSKSTWLSARWLSSQEISGLPLSIDTLQVQFNAKF
ncbi:MAG: outer membrane receptor for ferric coprogen and ferric-rhodotorulic acid [Rhodoferax ferrireducens]|uniref:Outer membrane receptor for ferric coprogen and ferric-rhodotorulic acid n=1 Tax=Rhodoferax ferrireducens TaxID=192843 RepID=A0A1W9KQT3_9BURK|nr:MAG: outer membrane receptor for ferric coprogen and ferric-rhodotorulic acid [Rhodoferax ferrireducens]